MHRQLGEFQTQAYLNIKLGNLNKISVLTSIQADCTKGAVEWAPKVDWATDIQCNNVNACSFMVLDCMKVMCHNFTSSLLFNSIKF